MIKQAGVEAGGIDERLENAARRTFGNYVIQLAYAIVLAANESLHLTRMWIYADERHLRVFHRTAIFLMAFSQEVLHLANTACDRFGRIPLQIWIKCRVNF